MRVTDYVLALLLLLVLSVATGPFCFEVLHDQSDILQDVVRFQALGLSIEMKPPAFSLGYGASMRSLIPRLMPSETASAIHSITCSWAYSYPESPMPLN